MNFWDSSAITPLLVDEPDSELREIQLRADPMMLVGYGTLVEIQSALNRRKREGLLLPKDARHAEARLDHLRSAWAEVEPSRMVRDRAIRLLRVHPLRAADAFQLAAALVACAEQTAGFGFFTADVRLSQAALAEGFQIR
jgi:predicted nucleic acid-binding protein